MSYQPLQSEDATLKPVAGSAPTGDAALESGLDAYWKVMGGIEPDVTDAVVAAIKAANAHARSQGGAPYPLPDSLYPDSKDWIASDYAGRVEWLHLMYEASKEEARALGCAGLPATDEQRCQDYLAGWNNSAIWAGREDLLSDVDSAAYIKERDALLASLHLPQDKKE